MLGRKVTALLRGSSQFIRISAPNTNAQSYFRLIASTRRTYATPGRPRSTVGEPSRPIKRAVKRASSPTKKAAPKTKPKKKVAKKAAKKPVKKAVKPKKEKTPEQIASKKARDEAKLVRELKQTALKPPATGAFINSYNVFFKSKYETVKTSDGKADAAAVAREISKSWKALTPAELEHYNHLAVEAQQQKQQEYVTWLNSHSPEQIEAANVARRRLRLREKLEKNKHTSWPAIADSRITKDKKALSPYAAFTKTRHASGDLKHISISDAAKLISAEWKELSEDQKQTYKSAEVSSKPQQRSTLAADIGYMDTSQPQAAAAAA